tara:strand:+ start:4531 stop:5118 length:588 start_codon:yes stop_codon:yes gene_type:complete
MYKYLFLLFILNLNLDNSNQKLEEAYFASGCFWCVESIYENLKGVIDVESGYSGGKTLNPTYYQVMTEKTGHAEAIKVLYDPQIIDFETLVKVFFGSHDPSTLNRQGPDKGTQYRSIAFFKTNNEKKIIETEIKRLLENKTYKKITTEILAFEKFYKAEEYHQDYKKNNPNDIYILRISNPRISKFKMDFKDIIK